MPRVTRKALTDSEGPSRMSPRASTKASTTSSRSTKSRTSPSPQPKASPSSRSRSSVSPSPRRGRSGGDGETADEGRKSRSRSKPAKPAPSPKATPDASPKPEPAKKGGRNTKKVASPEPVPSKTESRSRSRAKVDDSKKDTPTPKKTGSRSRGAVKVEEPKEETPVRVSRGRLRAEQEESEDKASSVSGRSSTKSRSSPDPSEEKPVAARGRSRNRKEATPAKSKPEPKAVPSKASSRSRSRKKAAPEPAEEEMEQEEEEVVEEEKEEEKPAPAKSSPRGRSKGPISTKSTEAQPSTSGRTSSRSRTRTKPEETKSEDSGVTGRASSRSRNKAVAEKTKTESPRVSGRARSKGGTAEAPVPAEEVAAEESTEAEETKTSRSRRKSRTTDTEGEKAVSPPKKKQRTGRGSRGVEQDESAEPAEEVEKEEAGEKDVEMVEKDDNEDEAVEKDEAVKDESFKESGEEKAAAVESAQKAEEVEPVKKPEEEVKQDMETQDATKAVVEDVEEEKTEAGLLEEPTVETAQEDEKKDETVTEEVKDSVDTANEPMDVEEEAEEIEEEAEEIEEETNGDIQEEKELDKAPEVEQKNAEVEEAEEEDEEEEPTPDVTEEKLNENVEPEKAIVTEQAEAVASEQEEVRKMHEESNGVKDEFVNLQEDEVKESNEVITDIKEVEEVPVETEVQKVPVESKVETGMSDNEVVEVPDAPEDEEKDEEAVQELQQEEPRETHVEENPAEVQESAAPEEESFPSPPEVEMTSQVQEPVVITETHSDSLQMDRKRKREDEEEDVEEEASKRVCVDADSAQETPEFGQQTTGQQVRAESQPAVMETDQAAVNKPVSHSQIEAISDVSSAEEDNSVGAGQVARGVTENTAPEPDTPQHLDTVQEIEAAPATSTEAEEDPDGLDSYVIINPEDVPPADSELVDAALPVHDTSKATSQEQVDSVEMGQPDETPVPEPTRVMDSPEEVTSVSAVVAQADVGTASEQNGVSGDLNQSEAVSDQQAARGSEEDMDVSQSMSSSECQQTNICDVNISSNQDDKCESAHESSVPVVTPVDNSHHDAISPSSTSVSSTTDQNKSSINTNQTVHEANSIPPVSISNVGFSTDIFHRNCVRNPSLDPNSPVSTSNKFSLASYNILAECHRQKGDYSYTSSEFLEQDYRHKLLMQELRYLDADILCLQEVNPQYFTSVLEPALSSLGYKGSLVKRTQEYCDEGEVTLYKTSRFSLEDSQGFPLSELATKGLEDSGLSADVKQAVEQYLNRPDVVTITKLRCLNTGKQLVIGNIHVVYDDMQSPDVQSIQIASAVKLLVSMAGNDNNPHILCGDFNSPPSSVGYQLACDGYLSDTSIASLQTVNNLASLSPESKSLVNHMWGAFQHTSSNLKSSYFTCQGCEPEVTSFTANLMECLDYVFYGSASLETEEVLQVVCKNVVEDTGGLPAETFPSDHLSLKANMFFK